MKYFGIGILCILALSACTGNIDGAEPPVQQAWVPVYRQPTAITDVKVSPARTMARPGKQYLFGNLLLQNELNEGIHLIDISNPALPRKLGFLEIPLCTEMAVKQGYLYANNYDDMLVFDLNGTGNPRLVKRIPDVFPPVNQDYPPMVNVAFECPDPSRGVVVAWELKQNIKANCRR